MSVIAIASLLATQAPITLLYQPKIGASYKYSVTTSGTSQMGNNNSSLTNTVKVLSAASGVYKIQSTNSNMKISGGGGPVKDSTTIMMIDKYGAIKVDPNGKDAMSKMMGGMSSNPVGLQFPKKAVKQGDTWTSAVDMGAMMGNALKGSPQGKGSKATGMLNLTFKLVKVDGSSASITCNYTGNMNMSMSGAGQKGGPQNMTMTMKMVGTSQYSVERSSGMLNSSSTKMSMDMGIMGQQMKMTQNITQKRI